VPARVMPKALSKNFAACSGSGTMIAMWRSLVAMLLLRCCFSAFVAHNNNRLCYLQSLRIGG
jgi:hypothetical protein